MGVALDQSKFQVRFEWGAAGLARLAPSDVVVVVDVLGLSSAVIAAAATSPVPVATAQRNYVHATEVVATAAATAHTVLLGGLMNASAVADQVLVEQERRGERTSVAIVACGKREQTGVLRFAVECQLGSGAIISALSDRGIDHASPEAAVAGEAFRALRGATRNLLLASGTAKRLAENTDEVDGGEELPPISVAAAAAIDSSGVVPTLAGEKFVRR